MRLSPAYTDSLHATGLTATGASLIAFFGLGAAGHPSDGLLVSLFVGYVMYQWAEIRLLRENENYAAQEIASWDCSDRKE